jgi:hypothetical protein
MRPDRSGGIKECTAEIGCTGEASKAMQPRMHADQAETCPAGCIEPCVIGAVRYSAQPATWLVVEHHPRDLRIIRPLPLPDTSRSAMPCWPAGATGGLNLMRKP